MTLRQREPRQVDPGFLAFVRRHPCCVCGAPAPSQAAHVRMACEERGKRSTGMAEKPADRWAVALCADCHLDGPEAQHKIGEARFWSLHVMDPFDIADRLYGEYLSAGSARIASKMAAKPSRQKQKSRPIQSRGFPPKGARKMGVRR